MMIDYLPKQIAANRCCKNQATLSRVFMTIRRFSTVIAFCLASAACAGIASGKQKPLFYDLPPFPTLVRNGETLKSIVIEEECAAMWGVQRLSDGWSSTLTTRGEDYTLTLFPPTHRQVTDFDDGPPQIEVALRGQWSDCYNLTLIVNVEMDGTNHVRAFRLEDQFFLPWIEDTTYKLPDRPIRGTPAQ
jgi:hypothetical protein